jgi:hypothetical protein
MLILIVANMMAMTIYSLWTVWTTQFLVSEFELTQRDANLRLAWWPAIFATVGGLLGGWLAQRQIRRGVPVMLARLRIALGASIFVFATAAAPAVPSAALATAAICLSLFATTCLSVNYYAIPLDLFGADRAAFAAYCPRILALGLTQPGGNRCVWQWRRYRFCPYFSYERCCGGRELEAAAVSILG